MLPEGHGRMIQRITKQGVKIKLTLGTDFSLEYKLDPFNLNSYTSLPQQLTSGFESK